MEKLTDCGCNPDLPSPQSLTERLAICVTCDKAATCFYPQTITLKMVKSAIEESTLDIQKIARSNRNFAEFHQMMNTLLDKQQPSNDHNFSFHDHVEKQEPPQFQHPNRLQPTEQKRNLRDIAEQSMTFNDFRERTTENDKLPPIKEKKQGLWELARSSMTFNDFHVKAEQR